MHLTSNESEKNVCVFNVWEKEDMIKQIEHNVNNRRIWVKGIWFSFVLILFLLFFSYFGNYVKLFLKKIKCWAGLPLITFQKRNVNLRASSYPAASVNIITSECNSLLVYHVVFLTSFLRFWQVKIDLGCSLHHTGQSARLRKLKISLGQARRTYAPGLHQELYEYSLI